MLYSNKYPRSVFRELQDFSYSKRNRRAIFESTKGSEDLVQRLKILKKLPIHNGCVNCICWNEKGNKILSGSDDQHLIITDPFTYQVVAQYRTNHRANIFSAKFLPNTNDNGIVSCCGDGSIFYTDLSRIEETQDCLFNCHAGTTYDVVTIPNDPNVFLSCGEDYTVRSFDLRVKNKCNKPKCKEDVIIQCRRAVTALTVNAMMPCQIAIGCADSTARLYDRRMVDGVNCRLNPVDAFIRPGLERKPYRITSLNFSPEGEDLLVSYSSEHVYLFGLRNSKDMIFSTESLCGSDEEEGTMGVWCSSEKGESVPVRRLRLRGDWSDTGPDARPHNNSPATASQGGRRVVQGGLIQRMTDVLSRMLNDPATRAALSQGGESEPSEQMQIEEGLGEYLGIENQRPAESNSGETANETAQPTTVHNENETNEGNNTSTEGNDANVMDVPSPDGHPVAESRNVSESNQGVTSETESPSSQNVQVTTEQTSNSPSQSNQDCENQSSQISTQMDTDIPFEPIATCSVATQSERITPCKQHQLSYDSTNLLSDDDDDIMPVKRAKDDRSSPFDDDHYAALQGHSKEVPVKVRRIVDLAHEVDPFEQIDDDRGEGSSQGIGSQQPSNSQSGNPSTSVSNSVNDPSINPMPSTSQYHEDRIYESPSSSNLTDLTDELSTMFNGFKQKYGKKPMVNLVYSVRGSTASTISMTVEDPNNRAPNSEGSEQTVPEAAPEVASGSSGEERGPVNVVEPSERVTPTPSEQIEPEPSASTSSPPAAPPAPSTSTASYPSTRFAVRMEKELCKAIRNARGENNQDETVRLKKANIRMKYTGHRNARTMIKEATFWGNDYVMSGSDCGHVFIWTRDTGRLVMTLQADNHVVNCLQPHPTLPILATSGIDYDLKLWAPIAPEPSFDFAAAQELMNRNAIMLEETKDTITVPASFMIRMLACLNQLRRGGPRALRRRRIPHD